MEAFTLGEFMAQRQLFASLNADDFSHTVGTGNNMYAL